MAEIENSVTYVTLRAAAMVEVLHWYHGEGMCSPVPNEREIAMTTLEVSQYNKIYDLQLDVIKLKREMTASAELLELAQHALAHGRLEVVAEFLDRSVTALRSV